jgi:hypothetical protein
VTPEGAKSAGAGLLAPLEPFSLLALSVLVSPEVSPGDFLSLDVVVEEATWLGECEVGKSILGGGMSLETG